MKLSHFAALALATAATPYASASAATLVVGAGWKSFYFGGSGSAISDLSGDTNYNFTLASAAELHVVDAYSIGDTFKIFNFGNTIGSTGAFDINAPVTGNAAVAFAGTGYSKLSVVLAPGKYSLSGIATSSPFGGGGAYIELAPTNQNAVPEPATWMMMICGYLVVGAIIRHRGRKLNAGYS